MAETGYHLRLAAPDDIAQIRKNLRRTMSNPEGRAQRKRYNDAIDRREMLVFVHSDPAEGEEVIEAFLEWHMKVDGTATIRDAGTTGEQLQVGHVRRLIREMLRTYNPSVASVKLRSDLEDWNGVFEGLPGFILEGREYSRPHWRTIWEWTEAAERSATRLRMGGRRR